ncbi:HAD family hydrolase [Natrarchaeobius chitinivorans]|uniref:HAD family hydrolase n=1 Tax=Natrarchaeobius chitinivorans TaxID=1679083 RepID=A0A3N6MPZ3_NATCH|nr:HAD family hydrolase [Natrarchaeobius chitinivorans]RQG96626.1 HAD family hydrolase [Natrarchaeobius chitinivorans]
MGLSFDLFGTLVAADRTENPAGAVATELERRDVPVPDDWAEAYAEPHVDVPAGAEVPLTTHVLDALASRGIESEEHVVRRAVVSAFEPAVRTNAGALEAVSAARSRGPVAVCSNCSVSGLVDRTLAESALDRDDFDAVVTSVDCGWRKPAPEIFETTADELEIAVEDLLHVGDDPRADGGIERIGGTALLLEESPLRTVPDRFAERGGETDR